MSGATQSGPVLVVHGGAGALSSDDDRAAYRAGVEQALRLGLAALDEDACAAVRAAVVFMEAHTIMNAGRGAVLAVDGSVALDAGFMVGASRRYGGVTGVDNCLNPVLLAEHLVTWGEYGRFLGVPGSLALAARIGVPVVVPDALVTERSRRVHAERLAAGRRAAGPWLDTVGAVALDARGRLAAAVSTGGTSLKPVGRVGDSPVVGAGFWADDRHGACVTTGVGEVLLRQGTARRSVQLLADGLTPAQAARAALDELLDAPPDAAPEAPPGAAPDAPPEAPADAPPDGGERARGACGLILVARDGRVAIAHDSREMTAGWARPDGSGEVRSAWDPPAP